MNVQDCSQLDIKQFHCALLQQVHSLAMDERPEICRLGLAT